MDKKIKILFILGVIIFVIAIFGINLLIKSYESESTVITPPQQINKQESIPVGKGRVPETPKEEPQREAPLPSNEPLAG